MTDEQKARAIKAIKTLPLPAQSASTEENYRRLLAWLYIGRETVASLVIELQMDGAP